MRVLLIKRATIGIDIGGTKTLLALFDEKFRVLESAKFKTHGERGEAYFKKALNENLDLLEHKASKDDVELVGVGIGVCGTVHPKTGMLRSASVPFLKEFPSKEYLRKKLKAPVTLGNDVHMGLYGEQRLGAAAGLSNVIGVFFGTGVGAALMIQGKLYVGTDGEAGDIGHYLVAPMGSLAGSEAEGSLNDLLSRGALAGKAAMLAARRLAPYLLKSEGTDVAKIRSEALAKSIAHGDKAVEELVRSRVHMVGIVLSNFVDFLNPEMVVLGGGVVDAMPSIFLKEIAAGIQRHSTREAQRTCKIAVSKLKNFAVAAGAAKMAWDTYAVSRPGL